MDSSLDWATKGFSNFGPNNCMEEKVVFKKLPLIFFRDDTVFVKMWFRMDKLQ